MRLNLPHGNRKDIWIAILLHNFLDFVLHKLVKSENKNLLDYRIVEKNKQKTKSVKEWEIWDIKRKFSWIGKSPCKI